MTKRTTQPKNNKYYIRKANGGYSTAIAGKPTIKGANVLCNCVGYAGSRFNEIIGKEKQVYTLTCNAENFIEAAKNQGLKISSTPVQGGIMVWQKGKTLSGSDGAGHVAVVEEVYDDGSILTSESGYNAWAFKTVKRNNSNGRWSQTSAYKFRGCIVNPAVKDPKVVPAPKLTVDGKGGPATVRATQKYFGTAQDGVLSGQSKTKKKYYPSLTAVEFGKGGSACVKKLQKWCGVKQDGILGKVTVKAWQKKIGVKADGIFGTASMKAWQKFLNTNWGKKATYPAAPKPAPKPSTPAAKPSTGTSTMAAKIVDRAKDYSWAYGTASKKWAYKTGSAKASYKAALKKYCGKKAKISQTDCGYFVNTCLRAAGIKGFDSLPDKASQSYPKLVAGVKIVHKGKKIPDGLLQPGDVIRYKKTNGHQHTLLCYAKGKIAEAGRSHWFPAIKKDTKKYNKSNVKISTLQVIRAK